MFGVSIVTTNYGVREDIVTQYGSNLIILGVLVSCQFCLLAN